MSLFSSCVTAANLPYKDIVAKHSGKYGFDPLFIHAQIQQESSHNPNVCSHAGACGLMQLMPGTARDLGVTNRSNPDQNVNGGVRYMRSMLAMFGGNHVAALRAYNWGPGNMRAYLRGRKKKMPPEAINYPIAIRKFYYSYGGKGSFFNNISGSKDAIQYSKNPNTKKQLEKLNSEKTCKPIKLPPQHRVSFENIPPLASLPAENGSGERIVFDAALFAENAAKVQSMVEQLKIMKGEYEAVTKGAAGLGLLQNISQLVGFELPKALPSGSNKSDVFQKKGGNNVYSTLAEQRAADTGVYGNEGLKKSYNEAAKIANHAYVEAEMAWTQVNCSINAINSLASVNNATGTQKASKDVGNRIALERAMLEANSAKLRSSLTMLNSSVNNYSLELIQANREYIKGKEKP